MLQQIREKGFKNLDHAKILEKEEIAKGIFRFLISAPLVACKARPGQFVVVLPYQKGERVPFTIQDSDPENGTITLVVQVVGKTSHYISTMEPGDRFYSLLGPLGVSLDEEIKDLPKSKVLIVGGGVGIAPLFPKAKSLKKDYGAYLWTVVGYRTKELIHLADEMKQFSNKFELFTDDGTAGRKGLVTVGVEEALQSEKFDFAVVIGPPRMMQAVAELTRKYDLKTLVSLNTIMVDGTGMCGSCRVLVGGKVRFACVDGPIFDGHEVDWNELAARNSRYRDEEKLSYELWLKERGLID